MRMFEWLECEEGLQEALSRASSEGGIQELLRAAEGGGPVEVPLPGHHKLVALLQGIGVAGGKHRSGSRLLHYLRGRGTEMMAEIASA